MEPTFVLFPVIAIGSPFLSFFAGVWMADMAGLYSHIPRRTLYLTAIPTGFIVPSMLAGSAVVTIGEVTPYGYMEVIHYGYMQHEFKLLLFLGTVMVYGSASPELFAAIKSKLLESRDGQP